jgi:hypothetical protein
MALQTFTAGQVLTAAQLTTLQDNSGLQFVKKQTIGTAVSSVTVTDAFNANYENYKILISGGVASGNIRLHLSLGAITTNYYNALVQVNYSATAVTSSSNNPATFPYWENVGSASTANTSLNIDILSPFLAKPTSFMCINPALTPTGVPGFATWNSGYNASSTSVTSFTVTTSGGTLTGGTIYVYGYGRS